jgi:hypothetical protein
MQAASVHREVAAEYGSERGAYGAAPMLNWLVEDKGCAFR